MNQIITRTEDFEKCLSEHNATYTGFDIAREVLMIHFVSDGDYLEFVLKWS